MKQQGFHITERSQHARRHDDVVPVGSQTSSKLADGLQGLMDMCNAGSLMSAPAQAMVRIMLLLCFDTLHSCIAMLTLPVEYAVMTTVCDANKLHTVLQATGGKVEVVGTTHVTTGVRCLVKSVVRGLKACQVSAVTDNSPFCVAKTWLFPAACYSCMSCCHAVMAMFLC